MDINARRRAEPFKPGELVYVRINPASSLAAVFDSAMSYQIKAGPSSEGYYEVWTDEGPRRYESGIHESALVPYNVTAASVED